MGCNCGEVHLHKKGKHQHHTWINLELLNTTPFASHKQWLMWIKISTFQFRQEEKHNWLDYFTL